MSRLKKAVLSTAAVLGLAAAVFLIPTLWFKPWSIDHFYTRLFGQFALHHPMMLSSLRLLEPMGLRFHNDDLDDMSVEFDRWEAEWAEGQLEILHSYDRDSMSPEEALSYDILDWFMLDGREANRWMLHNYSVDQLGGVHTNLPDFMINTHHLGDRRDAEDFVERVGKFGVAFDQVIEGLEVRQEMGIVPPRFVIRHVLETIRDLIEPTPTEHVLYTHLAERTAELEDIDAAARDDLLARLARHLEETVYPANRRLIACLEGLGQVATDDDGVWKFPDGGEFYDYRLRHYTTTDMTAEEIHRLGLAEVERIQAEMRAILESEGLPTDDLAATMNALNEDPRFLYPDTDEGRDRILADYQSIIDEIDAGLGPLFDVRPRVGVEVKRVPEFRQATAPGAYYDDAPLDGSKPGVFYANLRDVREIPKFGMRTLAYHEAVPGHHFQIAIAQELTGVPIFRRIISFTSYVEGWALYAELLAAEAGFQEDPYDRLGYLTGQIFRAVRLVVDTGIHAQRWTRQQAIDYMLANTGMPAGDVTAEIERYIVDPGQACAYKVGQLEILALREKARQALGEVFDIRQFHNVVLTDGALPLSLLERQVDRWIEGELASR